MAIKGNYARPLKQNKLSQRFTEALISAGWLHIKLKRNSSQVEQRTDGGWGKCHWLYLQSLEMTEGFQVHQLHFTMMMKSNPASSSGCAAAASLSSWLAFSSSSQREAPLWSTWPPPSWASEHAGQQKHHSLKDFFVTSCPVELLCSVWPQPCGVLMLCGHWRHQMEDFCVV